MLYDLLTVASPIILSQYKRKRNNICDYKWELVQQRYIEEKFGDKSTMVKVQIFKYTLKLVKIIFYLSQD